MANGNFDIQLGAIPSQRQGSTEVHEAWYIDELAQREGVRGAFMPDDSHEDDADLRSRIVSGIETVELIALGMRDSFRFRRTEQPAPVTEAALVQLGWLTQKVVYSGSGTEIVALHAEDAGVKEVDGLRAAKGVESIGAETARTHPMWKSAILDRRRRLQGA